MKIINLYTDGACSGNQNDKNIGGWGAILEYEHNKKELFGGLINTTNNIMEMTAVIEGLNSLKTKNLHINIYSDSAYVVNCFNQKWYKKWQLNGWVTSSKKAVENKELWIILINLVESFEKINFYKIKGHLKTTGAEFNKWLKKYNSSFGEISVKDFTHIVEMNNRADQLANIGMDKFKNSIK